MAEDTCEMCDDEAQHDVITMRSVLTLCQTCTDGQRQAGVVEAVAPVGEFK